MSATVSLYAGLEPCPGYKLRHLLGKGGYAEVWEASAPDGTSVALKFLPVGDSLSAAREIRSIQAVRQLDHPHLITIHQVWCQAGYIVVSMELAEGSLLDLLEIHGAEYGEAMPAEEVCATLHQAAEVLDFLNTRQHRIDGQRVAIQHCDVKPSNLLLCGRRVKLADFGLAAITTSRMQPHRRAGTLDYTAPEVFQGRLSDQTDQYSLAVTYCLLRGGALPFTDTPATFTKGYVRPAPCLEMLSEAERPIVGRALAPVPQDRWPSCRAFITAVALAATGREPRRPVQSARSEWATGRIGTTSGCRVGELDI